MSLIDDWRKNRGGSDSGGGRMIDQWRKNPNYAQEEYDRQRKRQEEERRLNPPPAPVQAPEPSNFVGNVFKSFTDYVQKNTMQRAGVQTPEQLSPIQKGLGYAAAPVYLAKSGWNMFKERAEKTGEFIAEGQTADFKVKEIETNNDLIDKWRDLAKRDESKKSKAVEQIRGLMERNKQLGDEAGGEIKKQTDTQLLGLVTGLALDATSAIPVGRILGKGGSLLARIVKGAIEGGAIGVPFGAAYGVTEKMREEGDRTKEDYIESAKSGAKAGGALGAILGGLGGTIGGKLARKEKPSEFVSQVEAIKSRFKEGGKPTFDMVTTREPVVNLRTKESPLKKVEDIRRAPSKPVTVSDIDRAIRNSGTKLTEGKVEKGTGKARFDFKTQTGEIVVPKGAESRTKAHEFGHVINYKLGKNDKITNQLEKFINNPTKENTPESILSHVKKEIGLGVPEKNVLAKAGQVAREIRGEIEKAAKLEGKIKADTPSEKWSVAVANYFEKPDEVKKVAPTFSKFIEEEVLKENKPLPKTNEQAPIAPKPAPSKEAIPVPPKPVKEITLTREEIQKAKARIAKIEKSVEEKKSAAKNIEEGQKQAQQYAMDTEEKLYERIALNEAEKEAKGVKLIDKYDDLRNAVRNNAHYIKEGTHNDKWRDAILMREGKRGIVRFAHNDKDIQRLTKLGYKQGMSVDALAKDAGYDDTYQFLEDFTDEMNSRGSWGKPEHEAHQYLLENDNAYSEMQTEKETILEEINSLKQEHEKIKKTVSTAREVKKAEPADEAKNISAPREEEVKQKALEYVRSKGLKLRAATPKEEALSQHVQDLMARLREMPEGSQARKRTEKAIREAENQMQKLRIGEKYRKEETLTTKILSQLGDRKTVSKQFISDLTNQGAIKQQERDIIRDILSREGGVIDVPPFKKKVQAELIPLKTLKTDYIGLEGSSINRREMNEMLEGGVRPAQYENVALPDNKRGKIENYYERIYQSPIETSAGDVHFQELAFAGKVKKYFGHTRVEDMADMSGKTPLNAKLAGEPRTRRVIEVQSDLFQKGNLEKEKFGNRPWDIPNSQNDMIDREREIKKLQQYNDPTAHFRMVREEVKTAADEGINKLQFPTGETAMEVEGLGSTGNNMRWTVRYGKNRMGVLTDSAERMKVGNEISDGAGHKWIISDVLGDGKFKAIPTWELEKLRSNPRETLDKLFSKAKRMFPEDFGRLSETFDISGKIDKSNPIYKFYEKDLGGYLRSKYKAELVTDNKGVTWWQVDIKPEMKGAVEAFRLKDDFAKIGVEISDEAESKIIALNKKFFGDENIKITEQILTPDGQKALGSYREGLIKILKGQGDAKDTFYHESFHKYLDIFTTEDEQANILVQAMKQAKTDDFAKAEEWLSESFINYAKSREGITGTLKAHFDNIIERIKTYFGNEDVIKKAYSELVTGKPRAEVQNVVDLRARMKAPENPPLEESLKFPQRITPVKPKNIPEEFTPRKQDNTVYNQKINTSQDVQGLVDRLSQKDSVRREMQKRGIVSWDQTEKEARELGINYKALRQQSNNATHFAAQVEAIKQERANNASQLHDFLSGMPRNPSNEQQAEIIRRIDQFMFLDRTLKSMGTEHGRAINILRKEVFPEEWEQYNEVVDKILEIDPKRYPDAKQHVKAVDKALSPTWADKILEWRYIAMLSGIKTDIVNMTGNTAFILEQSPARAVAGMIDFARAKITGTEREVFSREALSFAKGMGEGYGIVASEANRAFKNYGKIIRSSDGTWNGVKKATNQLLSDLDNIQQKRMGQKEGIRLRAIEGTKGKILRAKMNMLGVEDLIGETVAHESELRSQALRQALKEGLSGEQLAKRINQLIENPSKEIVDEVMRMGDYLTFKSREGKLTKWLSTANRDPFVKLATKGAVPFQTTIADLVKRGLEHTPFGFLKAAMPQGYFRATIGREITIAERENIAAYATMGSAAMYAFYKLAMEDKLTGRAPTDAAAKEKYYLTKQPNSIKIGDKWISYGRIDPFASPLAIAASLAQMQKEEGEFNSKVAIAGSLGFIQTFADKSWTKGIGDILEAVTSNDAGKIVRAERWLTSTLGSFVPVVTKPYNYDATMRESKTIEDMIKNQLPYYGGMEKPTPRIDFAGKEIQKEGSWLFRFLSPADQKKAQYDQTMQELEKSGASVNTLRLDEVRGIKLEGKAKEEWMKKVGQATKKNLDELIRDSEWRTYTQEEKDKEIKKTITETRDEHRDELEGHLEDYFEEVSEMDKKQKEKSGKGMQGKLLEAIRKIKL